MAEADSGGLWLVGIWSVVFGISSLVLYRLHAIDATLPKPAQRTAAH